MKKIIILISVYNDWESLEKLILEINNYIKDIKNFSIDFFIVNDASTIHHSSFKIPKEIKSLKILNMKKNKGHARCNAFGIRYILKNSRFDYIILMDGDGEDRPVEIKNIIEEINKNPNVSVVAKRIKRSEGIFFKSLYYMHKIITLLFTGKKINFGNYSCLTKNDAKKISSKASLWSSYSGTVKKNLQNLNEVDSIRGRRYFGPSQMSLFKLLIHSFSIMAVFKYQVLLRSILLILILSYFTKYFGISLIFLQILIIVFNLMIFLVSMREKKDDLLNSHKNLGNVEEVKH